jgi:hypothetical protein
LFLKLAAWHRLYRREKDIPIDMLELPNKSEKILQFAWEPRGTRFALLHGDGARPTGEPPPPPVPRRRGGAQGHQPINR